MPRGSHIGQLDLSMLKDSLPEQFLVRYDYDFLYQLKSTVINLIEIASSKGSFAAHSVLDELAIYLIMEEASAFIECISLDLVSLEIDGIEEINTWAFDLFGDMGIVTSLYSNRYLAKDHIYHFDHWAEEQFYIDETKDGE